MKRLHQFVAAIVGAFLLAGSACHHGDPHPTDDFIETVPISRMTPANPGQNLKPRFRLPIGQVFPVGQTAQIHFVVVTPGVGIEVPILEIADRFPSLPAGSTYYELSPPIHIEEGLVGKHWVTVEFTWENTADGRTYVSTYRFRVN